MNDDVHDAPHEPSPPSSQNTSSHNTASHNTSGDGVRRVPVTDLDAPASAEAASQADADVARAAPADAPGTDTPDTDTSHKNASDNSHSAASDDLTADAHGNVEEGSSEAATQQAGAGHDAFAAFHHASSAETEIDILRAELDRAHAELATLKANPEGLETLQAENKTLKDKFLRARADLENYRRRAAQDVERARNSGADGIVLAVLPVYDDLGRALEAAAADPSTLIPGIEAVRDGLKRNLEAQGIQSTGSIGERFDPTYHEALTSMPAPEDELKGTIAQVFQAGFVKDERLIRPAQVVVYQDD
ncbi:MAG: nucleotide exchange factor GrpE [Deinococcota bacterium]